MSKGWCRGLVAFLLLWATPLRADDAQRVVHLLDYIQVDYAEAVQDGAVISAEEFAEMGEFTEAVARLLTGLGADAALQTGAAELVRAVQRRADPDDVAQRARALRDDVVVAFEVRAAPRTPPDLATGAALYEQQCASCHGREGAGDGPAGQGLEPPAVAFTDRERAAQRSVLGYFNTITLGVEGTGMASYGALSEADRWALAFYVATLSADDAQRAEGEQVWRDGAAGTALRDLAAVAQRAPAELDAASARAQLAYLRAHPQVLATQRGGPLAHAREALAGSLRHYREGDAPAAYRAALSAYLDGFELIEQSLASRDRVLALDIERRMLEYRQGVESGVTVAEAEAAHAEIEELLGRADAELTAGGLSPALGFTSAFVILLREGVEAVLVLAAIVAFLRRARRPDALRYVHLGWSSALLAGLATAAAAAWLVNISGAVREMTEGVSALVAAAVLFYMGIWMHDKAHAQRWQAYIDQRLSGALGSGTMSALVLVSFLAVYRELFETILFYQALWLQTAPGSRPALIAGAGTGAVALAGTTLLVLRLSARLPWGLFFGASAALMYVLAVVFAGKGVMALQEAGRMPLSIVAVPRIDWLGIYPSAQALAAQAALVLLALAHLGWTLRARRALASP